MRPEATDRDLLRVARWAAIVGAALGLGLAMMHRSVSDALVTFYAVMVVTLFVPLMAGLYARHTSRRQGLASLVGVPVLAIVHFSTGGAGYGALTPTVAGVLVSALAFFATGADSVIDSLNSPLDARALRPPSTLSTPRKND